MEADEELRTQPKALLSYEVRDRFYHRGRENKAFSYLKLRRP